MIEDTNQTKKDRSKSVSDMSARPDPHIWPCVYLEGRIEKTRTLFGLEQVAWFFQTTTRSQQVDAKPE